MSKSNDHRNDANARSGNNYSRSEFNNAYHSVKSGGGDVNDSGQLERAANSNREYLSTSSDMPSSSGYAGYANQEEDL